MGPWGWGRSNEPQGAQGAQGAGARVVLAATPPCPRGDSSSGLETAPPTPSALVGQFEAEDGVALGQLPDEVDGGVPAGAGGILRR